MGIFIVYTIYIRQGDRLQVLFKVAFDWIRGHAHFAVFQSLATSRFWSHPVTCEDMYDHYQMSTGS